MPTVGPLVLRLGDGVLDLTSVQVAPVTAWAVGLVSAEVVRAGVRGCPPPRRLTRIRSSKGDQLRTVDPLAGCDQQGRRSASAFAGEVDFAGQAALRASESFVGEVLPRRRSFFRDSRRSTRGAGGVLVGPARGRIHADHAPVHPTASIRVGENHLEDHVAGAVR